MVEKQMTISNQQTHVTTLDLQLYATAQQIRIRPGMSCVTMYFVLVDFTSLRCTGKSLGSVILHQELTIY